jgi:hypothetical protein
LSLIVWPHRDPRDTGTNGRIGYGGARRLTLPWFATDASKSSRARRRGVRRFAAGWGPMDSFSISKSVLSVSGDETRAFEEL